MANEQFPQQDALEGEPQEYRIVLRRNARTDTVESLDEALTEPIGDDVEPDDVMWEGTADDLEAANLWEVAGLVPTLESDWYELQLKLAEGEYVPVATFSDQEDYDEAIKAATNPPPDLIGESSS